MNKKGVEFSNNALYISYPLEVVSRPERRLFEPELDYTSVGKRLIK